MRIESMQAAAVAAVALGMTTGSDRGTPDA